jgi:predicted membrane-bound spermidine synthase
VTRTPPPADSAPPRSVYASVFAISAATLLFQVTLIRIFSVSIWYHFAFLVVSVALFGIGASGVATSFLTAASRDRLRALAPLLFAFSTLFSYVAANAIPFAPFHILQEPVQILYFALYDLLLMIPFFFSGITIVLVLSAFPKQAGRLYAFDLVGAAAGTLLLFAVLPLCGARGAVALSAVLGALASAFFAPTSRSRRVALVAATAGLALVVVPRLLPDVRMDRTKPVTEEIRKGGARVFTRWNALARIDVTERAGSPPMIFIDGAAATPITAPRTRRQAENDLSSVACQLRPGAAIAIIGSGGGIDVQNALALDAGSVTAIEINPIILGLVRGRYRDYMGAAFENPRVGTVRDEGRSYVARSRRRFDVIQLTLIDTWAASVSGAYSLSENYLYTVEAFRAYIEHLTDTGMLSVTRWHYELPRLTALARAALDDMGVAEPTRHVVVLEQNLRGLVLVKRTPFTSGEMETVRAYAVATSTKVAHDPVWVNPAGPTFYDGYLTAFDLKSVHRNAPFAVNPVHDESPFFFQMAKWSRIDWRDLRAFGKRGVLEPLALPVAQIVLVCALVLGVLLSLGLLAVPLLAGTVPPRRRWVWLGYFFALGLAYIIVEVVLMQRFALFLGHPTYSVTAILFAILLFSGLGSAWSDRRRGKVRDVLRPVLLGLPVAIVLIAFAAPPLLRALLGLPLAARLAIAIVMVAPAAFLMGTPFPAGIRAIGATEPRHVAWAWAANGCASVIGSVCAVLGAMVWSFSVMLIIAMLIYILALVSLSRLRIDLA